MWLQIRRMNEVGRCRVQGQVTYLSTDKRTPLQIQNSCDLSCIWTTYTSDQHRFFLASQSIISNIFQLQLLRKQLSPTNHYTPVKHGDQTPDIHSLFQIIAEQHFSRWSEGPPLLCSVWGFRSDGCQWHRTLAVTYIPCIWQGYVGPNHFLFVRSPDSNNHHFWLCFHGYCPLRALNSCVILRKTSLFVVMK